MPSKGEVQPVSAVISKHQQEEVMTPKLATHLIYAIFFGSGISGLIYEIVWLRMLARIMGVTIYATSTVVAAFMAGLALGSFLFGRFIDRRQDPLRIYAALEFMIGATALLVPIIFTLSFPVYKYIYVISGENQILITVLRTLVCFLTLLLPTTIMGGTLPILTRWLVRRGILFGKSFSLLYGINTLGAACGTIVSGFVTLEILGENRTILLGVLINFVVAIMAYAINKKDTQVEEPDDFTYEDEKERKISPYSDTVRRVVLAAFVISGFTSLAYEVIWTRQLILFLQTSIYAFSAMLVIFLLGIALGSILMRNMVDRFIRPLVIFGICELLIGVLSITNLYLFPLFDSLLWPQLILGRLWDYVGMAVMATIVIVFPLTFLFGMIFPTASVCYAKDNSRTGASVGWLYSANTIGSIFGALLAGFLLIPTWGSTHAVVLLALVNVALGLLLIWMQTSYPLRIKLYYLTVLPILFLMIFQIKGQDPFLSTIELRIKKTCENISRARKEKSAYDIFFNKEGLEGTVTAFSINNVKRLWLNGIGMTSLCTETKLMAHLPIMYSKKSPKEMLIICFGMGTVLKSAILYHHMNITTVELVPEEYRIYAYYHQHGAEILKMKNIHAIVNDGRNYILMSQKKYDIITVDPAPPIYSSGTVNLYSREFLELCKRRLTPEGVMCLWFPGGREDEVKSILRTFHSVFPNTTVYCGPHHWGFYFIGSMKEISEKDFRDNVEQAFANPTILKDLREYDGSCTTPQQLYQMFLWKNDAIGKFTKNGVLITDNSPYTEFFLWRYLLNPKPIYKPTLAMVTYDEALRLKPDLSEAQNNLGTALLSRGQVDQAITHYIEALRLKPDLAEAHNNLGAALFSRGQVDQAITHYTEALRLKPHFAKAYNGLGAALAKLGRNQEAIAMFQKAIQINPNFSSAYYNLGLLFARQGDVDKAITMFQKVVQINPNNTVAQKMLSTLKARGFN
jgi:spermidine synthase